MSVTFDDLVAAKLLVQLLWRNPKEVAIELVALDRDPLAPRYLDGLRVSRILDTTRVQKLARYVALYDVVRRDALVAGLLERSGRFPKTELETWKDHLEGEGYRRRLLVVLREAGRIDAGTERELAAEQDRMIDRENERLVARYRRERFEGVDRPLTRDPKARVETGVFTIKRLFRSPESQRLSALSSETPPNALPRSGFANFAHTPDPNTLRLMPGAYDRGALAAAANAAAVNAALPAPRPLEPTTYVDTEAARAAVAGAGRTAPVADADSNRKAPGPGDSIGDLPTGADRVPAKIGDYNVERTIGAGGMGVVVLARRAGDAVPVAIKIARSRGQETGERFRREVLATSLVRHGNVVKQLGYGFLPDGTPYMILEYVPARELRDLLKVRTRFAPKEALSVIVQVLAALDAAHAAGVVHRDVKPENILVLEKDAILTAKLMDFGLARIDKDTAAIVDEDLFHTVATNVISGSPPYLSPEQIMGEPVDGRADLYATGVVLFEMLTGSLPFTAQTLAGYVRAHVGKQSPKLVERLPGTEYLFPAALEGLVARLLEKKSAARFADAKAVLAEIEQSVLPAITPSTELAATLEEEAPSLLPPAGDPRGITRILARLFARKPDQK